MKKIGIPRGMLYYENFPFWKDYFEGIGYEVVCSAKTNKDIMDKGILNSVDEACLPVKIMHGHVYYLKDKVDYIFIPKIISLHKGEYCCPKILGLSDMIKSSIDDLPEIIDIVFDLNKRNGLENGYKELGKFLGLPNAESSISFRNTYRNTNKYMDWIRTNLLPKNNELNSKNTNILILGHTYNVFDEFINMGILSKLVEKNINIFTAEDVSEKDIRKFSSFTKKRMFWTHGRRIIGAANYYLLNNQIDGIIYLSSFGCGLDSVLTYIVSRESSKYEIPFMNLTLDEQTGEAGMNTRLEAFLDMMNWRDRNKSYISTFR
ncbi:MAG: acyl-CoA dehydratase activase-related protein [Tissierellaceae bacterium]|nr:acyl-CoA dehydratase activase-related protein [Tissierellaceae bacterium]